KRYRQSVKASIPKGSWGLFCECSERMPVLSALHYCCSGVGADGLFNGRTPQRISSFAVANKVDAMKSSAQGWCRCLAAAITGLDGLQQFHTVQIQIATLARHLDEIAEIGFCRNLRHAGRIQAASETILGDASRGHVIAVWIRLHGP